MSLSSLPTIDEAMQSKLVCRPPRQRARPRTLFYPELELPPLDRVANQPELLRLFDVTNEVVDQKTGSSISTEVANAAHAFRDALVQQARDASRAEDRAADRDFAKAVRQLTNSVKRLSRDECALLEKALPPLPRFYRCRRVFWMADIERATVLMVARLSEMEPVSANMAAVVEKLSQLLPLFAAFWNARAHPMVISSTSRVKFSPTREAGIKRYLGSLNYIVQCASDVADYLKLVRGPDANVSIFTFLANLDKILIDFRGYPLKQLDGWTRSEASPELGDDPNCKSADEIVVMSLVKAVSDSVPDDLKNRLRSYFFDHRAVGEALKIHIAARNAAERS